MKEPSSNKARARWAILRGALLGENNDYLNKNDDSALNIASIHSFPGFCLLERRPAVTVSRIDFRVPTTDDKNQYQFLEYKVPIRDETEEKCIVIRTREKRVILGKGKVNVKALVSERYFGVDNTSNIKVWDCEGILTFCLMRRHCCNKNSSSLSSSCISLDYLSNMAIEFSSDSKDDTLSRKRKILRVLELGCGMVGIAGLAISCLEESCPELFQDTQVQVILTDGHPEAINNNLICASLNSPQNQKPAAAKLNLTVLKLLWKESQDGAKECAQLSQDYSQLFHLVLVSDCLHFVNFHAALACTIGRLLDVHGLAILCQPPRGASLEQFLLLLDAVNNAATSASNVSFDSKGVPSVAATSRPLFEVTLLKEYDDVVTNLHQQFLIQYKETYRPTSHYPFMLLLRKLRHYDETTDTQNAIRHVQLRTAASNSTL